MKLTDGGRGLLMLDEDEDLNCERRTNGNGAARWLERIAVGAILLLMLACIVGPLILMAIKFTFNYTDGPG